METLIPSSQAPCSDYMVADEWMGAFNQLNTPDSSVMRHQRKLFISLLCTDGEGCMHVNNEEVRLSKNDLLMCPPGTRLEEDYTSTDFSYCGFYLSQDFLDALNNIPADLWNLHLYLEQQPLMHLSNEEGLIYRQYNELIASKLNATRMSEHHRTVTTLLMQAFLYEFHDTLIGCMQVAQPKFTSGDNLFYRFIDLIIRTYPKPRTVTWYAAQLNVTPKYLSAICKRACNYTASEVINRYVLKDVQRLLMRPERSIKEIVNELDFPGISFFGKYVKKHLGASPRLYRKQLNL